MIWIEGNILSPELLEKLSEQSGQKPEDFGLKKTERLADEISRCWADAKDLWRIFKRRVENLPEEETGTTETRNIWMVPFLQNLLSYQLQLKQAEEVDGLSFAISHRDAQLDSFPILIIGCNQKLDNRYERQRQSAHSLMQDYLNRTEHTYGIIANGNSIRLLRDSARLVKQQFVEWDMQRIIEEDRYTDFVLLFRLLHRTRMPWKRDAASECFLEQYHQTSIDEGNRIRDNLRNAVMKALEILGNGFISHAANASLRDQLTDEKISSENYSRMLRRVVYRLLFLMVAEERELVFPGTEEGVVATPSRSEMAEVRRIYRDHYSISRFRMLSEKMSLVDRQQQNIWQELLVSFSIFEEEAVSKNFGIGPLNGDLFNANAIGELNNSKLLNRDLLNALQLLNIFENENGTTTRINYKLLDVEELGSVYESLLDLHPLIELINGTLHFRFVEGMERKTTGSYYTRSDLVHEIIKSALEPVVAESVKQEHKSPASVGKIGMGLLSLKVCDPACGSGHFLLAAARCIARELSKLRSGDEQPTPTVYRQCLREVIQHCIYGVDMNPDAVELCKLALWLESHNSGKPLSFLDHKIRCGNSLVGVMDMNVLLRPIPDEAFSPVTGDDREVCRELKRRNRNYANTKQTDLFSATGQQIKIDRNELKREYNEIENVQQDTVAAITEMKSRFGKIRQSVYHEEQACNIWTSAFFKTYTAFDDPTNPTSERLEQYFHAPTQYGRLVGEASKLALENKYFHWPLEFPDVFEQGGFDCMVGNPPWERIKLQEQEFFATRNPVIADAPNKAARERLIKELREKQPQLFQEFTEALHTADAQSKFLREGGRFPLTSSGDINTYAVFSELFLKLINEKSRAGLIVPAGISSDSTTKEFFSFLIEKQVLIQLIGFENEEFIFPTVHHAYKFCSLIIKGKGDSKSKAKFTFFHRNFTTLQNNTRYFELDKEDLKILSPNTNTCPVFRTSIDAQLTLKIYRSTPVLINDHRVTNPWGLNFMSMFHMSNDSSLFRTKEELTLDGYEFAGFRMQKNGEVWLPLFEAKLIHQFNHRFSSFEKAKKRDENVDVEEESLSNSNFTSHAWYYIQQSEVLSRVENFEKNYLLGFRDITNATNERTTIFSVLPIVGSTGINLIFLNLGTTFSCAFLANWNSLVFDFVARQKIGGMHLSQNYTKQFPVKQPLDYSKKDFHFIVPCVIELTYTAWDIKPFADDVWNEADEPLRAIIKKQHEENKRVTGGHNSTPPTWLEHDKKVALAPFKWSEERRAVLKAELDAYYAKLYGLTEEELRYILFPQDVYGENFPGETFRVLKEKEERKYGEYRTRRLVMEAWKRLNS